jgi:hypothetical protein
MSNDMILFSVTVYAPGSMPEQINILSDHACNAVTMAFELLFGDSKSFEQIKKGGGLKIAVEPISREES